jgi:uncharacterized protein with FMN-binding domain
VDQGQFNMGRLLVPAVLNFKWSSFCVHDKIWVRRGSQFEVGVGGRMNQAALLRVLLIGLVGIVSLTGCKNLAAIKALTIDDVAISTIKDGTYEGYQNNTMVTAKVSVEVNSGKIVAIRLLEHTHGPNHGADAIIPKVIEKQSLIVDSVSGATYSSKVLLKAIESALKKGQ